MQALPVTLQIKVALRSIDAHILYFPVKQFNIAVVGKAQCLQSPAFLLDFRFVEGPNDFVARLYHAERDTKTPIVILTQNDPVFPECYPLPYVGKDMRFDLKFSSKDALNRMAELINMLTQVQDHYQRAVAGHLGQDYVFQFPSDFYTVLDFSYFTTASEFLSHASIGMLIKETSMGSYALLSMALHTDVPLEVPLVIFSVITLK
jgi:hypothetical protein